MDNVLEGMKKAGIIGRGGSGFPTHLKWQAVKNSKDKIKYIVINGAEGEPGVYKDGYILENYLDDFLLGVKFAFDFIKAKNIYFYLNREYYDLYKNKIIKIADKIGLKNKFSLVEKPLDSGYVAGEETSILNIIEGESAEPRVKPPLPTCHGLYGSPTLINNVETIYNIFLLSKKKFQNKRFYSVNFDKKNKGVYFLLDNLSIEEVLRETNNYPKYDFFVQIGGDASGEVLNSGQLDRKVDGAGSITIYNLKKHNPEKLFKYWLSFFRDNSCGQCTPCREGTYRLFEIFKSNGVDMNGDENFQDLCDNLFLSSLCGLGSSAPVAVLSYLKNVKPLLDCCKNNK